MKEVVDFLLGKGPLEGIWFHEAHPSGQPFWWRSVLANRLERFSAPSPADIEALPQPLHDYVNHLETMVREHEQCTTMSVEQKLLGLLNRAEDEGLTIRVDQRPLQPLAMGNYVSVATVWKRGAR